MGQKSSVKKPPSAEASKGKDRATDGYEDDLLHLTATPQLQTPLKQRDGYLRKRKACDKETPSDHEVARTLHAEHMGSDFDQRTDARIVMRKERKTRSSAKSKSSELQPGECIICGDEIAEGLPKYTAPCPDRHVYDQKCLLRLVFATMKDATLMPPRCCQVEFDEDAFLPLLNTKDKEHFMRKREEFGTKDPLYCSNVSCSAFLGPAQCDSKEPQSCKNCRRKTCKACKGQWHGKKRICPLDSDEVAIEKLEKKGMSRCPVCRRMVERASGCDHIVSALYSSETVIAAANCCKFLFLSMEH